MKKLIELLRKYLINLPEIDLKYVVALDEFKSLEAENDFHKYWKNYSQSLIRKNILNEFSKIFEEGLVFPLGVFERKGILNKIKDFIIQNNLEAWTNELVYFAINYHDYYLKVKHIYAGSDVKNGEYRFYKAFTELKTLFDEMKKDSIWSEIKSISIKTNNPQKSILIKNHQLLGIIHWSIRKEIDEFEERYKFKKKTKENTKDATYFVHFIKSTYPLYQFFKNECNLNKDTDKEYYLLISEFLECIGIDLTEIYSQLPEDYIKDCYKSIKNKGLETSSFFVI